MKPSGFQIVPRWGQDGAKRAPRWAKTGLDDAKMGPGVDDDGRTEPPRKTLKKGSPESPRFESKTGPKMGSKTAKNRDRFLTSFGTNVGFLLEPFWEPFGFKIGLGGAQENQRALQETKKTIVEKVVFA